MTYGNTFCSNRNTRAACFKHSLLLSVDAELGSQCAMACPHLWR